jgi:hypothetical protein
MSRLFQFAVLLLTLPLHAQTNIAIPVASGSGIALTLPARFGINLGDSFNYGNNQLTANLLAADGVSFTPQIWQQSSQCARSTSNAWTDRNAYNPQPANFARGATYQVISGPNQGATGTIKSSVAGVFGSSGAVYITSGKLVSPCVAGGNADEMILRCRKPLSTCAGGYAPSQLPGINVAETGGGKVTFETIDRSPASSAPQALQLTAAGMATAGLTAAFDGVVLTKPYINLNGSYTLSFRAKGRSGTPVLNYSVYRAGAGRFLSGSVTPEVNATAGEGWTNYSYSFTASETGSQSSTGQVSLDVTGGTVVLQDVALTEAPTGGNTTVFRNAVYEKLVALHPGMLRMMTGNSWGCTPDNMMAAYSARSLCGFNSYQRYGQPISYGWSDFLNLTHAVGATDAWITFSAYATPGDMANIAAYLSGACGDGNAYTAMRCDYGQTTPWTGVFHHIYLEMGNEVWNSPNGQDLFGNGGQNYGNLVARNVAALKASKFYKRSMKFVASGFILQSDFVYGWNWTVLTAARPHLPDYIDGATYLFPDMTDLSSMQNIFGPMFAEPENYVSSTYGAGTGYTYGLQHYSATTFPGVNGAIYETNLTTNCAITGTTQGQINQVAAGVGAGLDATLAMLLAARDAGIGPQAFFSFPEAANKFGLSTSANSGSCPLINTYTPYQPLWGANLMMPGPSNANSIDRPSGIALQVINNAIGNNLNLLATRQSGTPTYKQPAAQPNPTSYPTPGANSIAANAAVPYVQSFGFSDGSGHYTLIVYNTNLTNSEAFTFSGAGAPSGTVTRTIFTSPNITDNNEGASIGSIPVVTYPRSLRLNNPSGDTLAPYSMATYTWSMKGNQ